ncbi:hypothetical protein IEQ34_003166 [Dendrobium chrysotoxum]|uniref:Uncharacterized protein n=1 Tax=Dendrobium chrysotoxum TaxID=161865 RepID=A0AAV7HJ77_DENCH|nr:hypothetical protein IEQ34_003166 [Dendrobium chrysotoxum]
MHTLAPFGADLLSSGRVEDNMTWNFVAGLAVAREILECYGCVIRVVSPRKLDAALGAGGTRIELWLPDVYNNQFELHKVREKESSPTTFMSRREIELDRLNIFLPSSVSN